ncbi:Zinc finger BED domain [Sesbania bispinosa]|nr:Zinc finger BED domain [Sesbania bispinosa]
METKAKNRWFLITNCRRESGGGGVSSSPTYFKFDQELCRTELVKMFVVAELPFRFVENEAFCKFLAVLQPRFSVPSRSTLTRDIYTLFNEEKEG